MRRRSATFGGGFAEFHFGDGEIVILEYLTDLFASLSCCDTVHGSSRKCQGSGGRVV